MVCKLPRAEILGRAAAACVPHQVISPAPVGCTCKQLTHVSRLRMRAIAAGVTRHANAVLTVGLCADEAGGGAVEEGEEAGHGQADVRVGGPQVQSGEPGEVDLQDVLWSHLNVGHLRRDTEVSPGVADLKGLTRAFG